MGPVGLRYEGLRELAQAFRETDRELLAELKDDLGKVGDVVRDEARSTFDEVNVRSAAGFETRVRAGGAATALVVVAQSLPKTTGLRPDYGALQVRYMLRAREAKLDEAERVLEDGAYRLLKEHGF